MFGSVGNKAWRNIQARTDIRTRGLYEPVQSSTNWAIK